MGRLLGEPATALGPARTAREGVGALTRACLTFIREHRDAALLVHSSRADRIGMERGKESCDAQEARVSAFAEWLRPRIEAGEVAPLPLPPIESLVLGPVVGTARRRLSGHDDVDLDEAAHVLPDRIWRSISAEPA
ncbi:hypothetical protein SUDANB176_04241 [Streptomyces sp. enrichment culture]|uniref:hypothetical protein n=1 Tax=Streptomyces sp. enrichment culture TaxID=1795815 RepID=UPI003F567D43